jgi:hypothetical protein
LIQTGKAGKNEGMGGEIERDVKKLAKRNDLEEEEAQRKESGIKPLAEQGSPTTE